MIALRSDQVQAPPSAVDAPAHNPPCLDGGGKRAQIRRLREIGEIVFLLPAGTLLTNEPGFVAWEMLLSFIPYSPRRAVGGADTESSKSGLCAGLSSRYANSGFSVWRWPAFVLPQSTRYRARGAFVDCHGLW